MDADSNRDSESDNVGPLLDFSNPVPNEILAKIFSHCTPDDVDNCKKVRRQWYHVIKDAADELPQRKITVKLEERNYFDVLEVKSIDSGKKIRIDIQKIREQPPFNIFEGCIVSRMEERLISPQALRSKLKWICVLGGGKIPVEKFVITLVMRRIEYELKHMKEYFHQYVDARELEFKLNVSAFSGAVEARSFWQAFDFGPTQQIVIDADWIVKQEHERDWLGRLYAEIYQRFFTCTDFDFGNRVCLSVTFNSDHLRRVLHWVFEGFNNLRCPKEYFKKLTLNIRVFPARQDDPMDSEIARLPFNLKKDGVFEKTFWLAHPARYPWGLEAKKTRHSLELKLVEGNTK